MPHYFTDLAPLLMLLLGWLLGLLAAPITDRIRRGYRRKDLIQAVVHELLGLQYTMILVAYMLRSRSAELPDAFLDFILPIAERYHGLDRHDEMIVAMKAIRETPEQDRLAIYQAQKRPQNVGVAMKQYALPLFAAQVSDLAICPFEFQSAVLHIRYQLDLFNQTVSDLRSSGEKTFTDLTPESRKAVMSNIEICFQDLKTRAESIVNAIETVKERHQRDVSS